MFIVIVVSKIVLCLRLKWLRMFLNQFLIPWTKEMTSFFLFQDISIICILISFIKENILFPSNEKVCFFPIKANDLLECSSNNICRKDSIKISHFFIEFNIHPWQLKITLKNIFNIRHWWNQSCILFFLFYIPKRKLKLLVILQRNTL